MHLQILKNSNFLSFSFVPNFQQIDGIVLIHIFIDGSFVDREFPPKASSLYNINTSKLHRNELRIWKEFSWKRPSEWMSGEPKLFDGDIDPSNLVEGYLGNAYFISTLKALAENPENIKRLFDMNKPTKEGQYIVNLCLNGENYKVEVDDFFPYCDKMKKPAFIRSKKNEIWPMLIEKAWAKVSGSYENSIKGLCCESFRALTGAPVEYVNHTYIKEVWSKISEAFYEGSIICAMAEKESSNSFSNDDFDLFSAYAYAVTKVHEIDSDEGKIKILQIRNPGTQKWLSMFSDTSKVWRSEVKKAGLKPASNDSILISIEDYLCYFRTTLICKANSRFAASSLRCRQNFGEASLIRISVSSSEKVSFTATQFNQKYVGRSKSKDPSFIRMIVGKENENPKDQKAFPITYIGGLSGFEESLTITKD
jgi:calpain-15